MARKITDEQRDEILTRVLVYREKNKDAAVALGVSETVVARTVSTFIAVRDKDWQGLKRGFEASTPGVTTLEWAANRARVEIPADVVAECKRNAEEKSGSKARRVQEREAVEQETAEPETAPLGPKMHIPAASAELGWQTRIKVAPDRVCMTVYFNGVKVVEGWSRVRGNKELDLMQAISYAAHMCYKQTEQKKLGGR